MKKNHIEAEVKPLLERLDSLALTGTAAGRDLAEGGPGAFVGITDQVMLQQASTFAKLIVVVAGKMEETQQTIKWLNKAVLLLTVVVAADAFIRLLK